MKLLRVIALAFAVAFVLLPCAEARPENNPEQDKVQVSHQGDHGEPPVTDSPVASPTTTVASNASDPVPTDPPADDDDPAKGVDPVTDGGVTTLAPPSGDESSKASPSSTEAGETTTEQATDAPKSLDPTTLPEDEVSEKTEEKVTTAPSTASPQPHGTLIPFLSQLRPTLL